MSISHILIQKGETETSSSTLRRFTKKVQESRLIQKVKGDRYAARNPSKTVLKKNALRRIAKLKETARLKKLGKIPETPVRGRRR
ncbi:MAG: hypothetical protein KBB88_02060 [Candidatus Pacebacteria bacterium]|nr:hypothetical protein [Candidatus Paceibacterota bacterium]